MSSKITITLFDKYDKLLNGSNELASDDLCISYLSIDNCGHGLLSNYEEPDEKYYKQLELCKQIIKLSRELKEISKGGDRSHGDNKY